MEYITTLSDTVLIFSFTLHAHKNMKTVTLFIVIYSISTQNKHISSIYFYRKGEEIFETARREVLEETGIETEFVGVTSFRHQQGYRYGCGDFYFICVMKPVSSEQEINVCQKEIANCKWVDVSILNSKS